MSTGSVTAPSTVLPRVLLVLPVQDAVFDLADQQWQVKQPYGTHRFLAAGKRFPFRERNVWVYTQLQGGLRPIDLAVQVRQRHDTGNGTVTYRTLGPSVPTRIDFDPQRTRLTVYETAFHFKRLPYREEGTYEFRVYAILPDGTEQALNGPTAEVTILDPAGRV